MATGTRFDGGFAEYALVRARQVYKLPNSVSLKLGALSEPISCIIRGIERADLQPPGFQSILIIGAGIIGNLWSAVLHHMGHRDVTIVEPQKIRIDMNKKIETGYKCYTPEEFRKAIELDGHSWDLAIDCSGNSRAIEEAVHALRFGGTLVMFGVAPPTATIRLSPFDIYKKELKICGSNINPFCMPRAVKLIEAMGERYLSYERLGIKEFQLREYTKGMEMLASSNIAKLMFAINPALDKTTGK
ncbi:hypothetical protein O3M35_009047 [Rhynocoris fuscipes]|uniref:Alcohol dehydrogenase-like C-terminal domain-containing protein n=1 Tax=Rhynocoris fuscipes TaxID=488301 RepID=A0AAW1D6W7_9HEMI